MAIGVRLECWGEWALFTRPEMKVERVSYDVMTPSAARGVVEAIYWKPEIRWVIDRITVLRPIQFTSLRRNEVADKIPAGTVSKVMKSGEGVLQQIVTDVRQQRAALLLKNVRYLIEAHFDILSGEENPGKHLDTFQRRARNGECFTRPYFGCREFAAHFRLVEHDDELPVPHRSLQGERDLGWMLHDLDFSDKKNREARFFRATMRDGVIDVPALHEAHA